LNVGEISEIDKEWRGSGEDRELGFSHTGPRALMPRWLNDFRHLMSERLFSCPKLQYFAYEMSLDHQHHHQHHFSTVVRETKLGSSVPPDMGIKVMVWRSRGGVVTPHPLDNYWNNLYCGKPDPLLGNDPTSGIDIESREGGKTRPLLSAA
jgi:hypothetical protein